MPVVAVMNLSRSSAMSSLRRAALVEGAAVSIRMNPPKAMLSEKHRLRCVWEGAAEQKRAIFRSIDGSDIADAANDAV